MTDPGKLDVAARLAQHEAVCAERWAQIRSSVRAIWWLILVSAGTVICGQAGLIVTLVLRPHG